MVIGSMYVTIARAMNNGISHGDTIFTTSPKERLDADDSIYRDIPTGGVNNPINKYSTRITPIWIGLILAMTIKGVRIGSIIIIAATTSINIPRINRIRLIRSRIT